MPWGEHRCPESPRQGRAFEDAAAFFFLRRRREEFTQRWILGNRMCLC